MKIQRYIAKNMFGTNAYLVWDEESKKAFIVDPGAEFPEAVDLIEKQGLELEYIMITHAHGDHTGGINFFREHFPEAKLLAARAERKMLYDRHASMGKGGYTADVEVRDGDTLTISYRDVSVDGNAYISAAVLDREGILHAFGRLAGAEQEGGSVTIDLSGAPLDETERLFLFLEAEQEADETGCAGGWTEIPPDF